MHEMHLLKDLMDDLLKNAEKNRINKITRVKIRLGEFTEINKDILIFFLKEKSKGTPAEGMAIDIEDSPARELRLVSFSGE
jgi:Zn finger protein HypA/HybF involved in hydrogenase expression